MTATVERAALDPGRVASVLGPTLDRTVEVEGLVRLAGGASRETYLAQLRVDGRPRGAIVQRNQPWVVDFALAPSVEAAVLRAAATAGVRVPTVLAWDDGADALGAPCLITEQVPGESRPHRVLGAGAPAIDHAHLAGRYAEELARLQLAPIATIPGLPVVDALVATTALLDRLDEPHPVLELGLRWLAANRPAPAAPASTPVLVHGDFRNGNAVVDDHDLRAIIDWELAHGGDPHEDLAWFCLRAWRYGRPLGAGGLAPITTFVDRYATATGRAVDPAALLWWAVLGTVRWGVLCIVEGRTHRDGLRPSIELAMVGRRVAEAEHDLVLLLP